MTADHKQYWIPVSAEEFDLLLQRFLKDVGVRENGVRMATHGRVVLISYNTAIYDFLKIEAGDNELQFAQKNPEFYR